ncbi:mitochondrial amidoxime reducing component 2-like [Iris pallida]|uniref:Mitochondrial amidoxime reducing component 2-like n=1 Tax=Iris pallida TaxID=29817 RepID=A0AAX6H9C1_IRIPA|nr:mitochondrial amidoxime reducing component 2-like [Iris pallida]
MFSDCFSFLVISQGSLNTLNELLQEPVLINRFRPNIVVDGCEPFSEDIWKSIKMNRLTFHGVKLCSRCKVPTINQENGISGVEPTETLIKFRPDHVLNLNNIKARNCIFWTESGLQGIPSFRQREISLGDQIFVLEEFASCASAAV